MFALKALARLALPLFAAALVACSKDSPGITQVSLNPASCPGINLGPKPASLSVSQASPSAMTVFGNGLDTVRYTAEIAVRGTTAYTTTWGFRRAAGNKINIWDVSG